MHARTGSRVTVSTPNLGTFLADTSDDRPEYGRFQSITTLKPFPVDSAIAKRTSVKL